VIRVLPAAPAVLLVSRPRRPARRALGIAGHGHHLAVHSRWWVVHFRHAAIFGCEPGEGAHTPARASCRSRRTWPELLGPVLMRTQSAVAISDPRCADEHSDPAGIPRPIDTYSGRSGAPANDLRTARPTGNWCGVLERVPRKSPSCPGARSPRRAGRCGFTWAGSQTVGDGHYYAVTGPTFLSNTTIRRATPNHYQFPCAGPSATTGRDVLRAHYGRA